MRFFGCRAQFLPQFQCIKTIVNDQFDQKLTSAMFSQATQNAAPRVFSCARKVVTTRPVDRGFDPQDPLATIREYRLRKVASKRIPSRIS